MIRKHAQTIPVFKFANVKNISQNCIFTSLNYELFFTWGFDVYLGFDLQLGAGIHLDFWASFWLWASLGFGASLGLEASPGLWASLEL